MVKKHLFKSFNLSGLVLAGALTLSPAFMNAETFNMPQFGRVEKPVTEAISFYDMKGTGAITSSSSNNSFSTVVFTPANPGEAVQITFSKIHLKGDGKNYPVSLSIFDGNYNEDVTYPESTSSVSATDFPDNGHLLKRYYSEADKTLLEDENVTFTSTDPDGSLSVCFLYKYAATCDGWEATVSSVTLTDQELLSLTPDYSAVNTAPYGGLTGVNLGSLNLATSGILSPFSATSLSFELDDPQGVMENLSLYCNGTPLDATVDTSGNTHTYTFNHTLVSGDNIFTVKADIKSDAPFFSTASLKFTAITTDAPATPTMADAEAPVITIPAVVMMPTDGSHLTVSLEDGKPVSFYDDGGPDSNYTINTSGTVTFKPAEGATGKVMIDFSALDLFNTSSIGKNDVMVVYNGQEANPDNELVTLLKQTKAIVRSTADDGALTVSFQTVTGIAKAGWESTASLFIPTAMSLVGTDVAPSSTETLAAGDTDCQLLKVTLKTKDTEPPMTLSGISLDFDGTSPQWSNVRIYSTGNNETFSASASLLAEAGINGETASLSFEPVSLVEGENYLWVVADVKESAVNGSLVNTVVKTVTLNGEPTEVALPSIQTGREVYNIVYPSKDHPVKTVYGSMNLSHKPYSTYYTGYDGSTDDQCVTFIPAEEGYVCEIDFSRLNLYYYESTYYPSSNVTPEFKIFAGTSTDDPLLYSHEKANNFESGKPDTKIGTIRSTAEDGSLTILFNAGTSSSSYCKSSEYGFIGEVREYQSRQMTVTSAEGLSSGLTSVAVTNASNVPVVGVKITTDGNLSPVIVDNISFELKADPTIYTSVRLASSGKQLTADNATVIATGQTDGTVVTFTPEIALGEGDNCLWLLADIDANAAPGSVVDAKITSLTVNSAVIEVANADPEGEILTVNTYDPILGDKDQVVEVGEYPVLINGVTAAYLTNDYTITAIPAAEGGKVTAKFTEGSFNVNPSNQYITVTGGSEPLGVDCNTVYPVSVTSTREDGSLTIEYHSMTIAKPEGWKCELSCDLRKPLAMEEFSSLSAGNGKGTAGSESLLYGLKVNVTGDKDPIAITSFDFDIPSASDIFSELRVYTSGSDAEFLRNTPIATLTFSDSYNGDELPSVSIAVDGDYTISTAGDYHFWLQGVVKADAANALTTTITPEALRYTLSGEELSASLSALEANSFKVVGGFNGTYRIGCSTEADYVDFATAIADMEPGINGPVTLLVEPGTYTERIELDHIPGVSETNTITLAGLTEDPSDVTIQWNIWNEPPYSDDKMEFYYGVITLRGTSFVNLNGITVKTTNLQMPSVIHIADAASDIEISNCIISGPTSGTTYYNLSLVNTYVSSSAVAVSNNLTISSTDFIGGYTGVKFGASTINQPESEGLEINGCSFVNQGYQAIYVYFTNDVDIIANSLSGNNSEKSYAQMIDLNISGPARIERNVLDYSKSGVYGMYLRRLAGSDDAPIIIANNVVNVNVNSSPGAGIQLYNSNQSPFTGFVIAHNSVLTNGSDVVIPLIINIKTGTTLDGLIANNIFQNMAGYYVIKEQYGPSGATYAHNVGYTERPDFGYAYWGGNYDEEMTFNQWALKSGETDGVNARVNFSTDPDANLLYPQSFKDINGGEFLSQVPADILGNVRSTASPSAGAYEGYFSGINATVANSLADGMTLTAGSTLTLDAADADIRVYSLNGMLLLAARADGQPASIDVSALPRGLCILTVGDRVCRLMLR